MGKRGMNDAEKRFLLCYLILYFLILTACEKNVEPEPSADQPPPTEDTLFDEYIAYSQNDPDTVKILKEYGTYNECRVFSIQNQMNKDYSLKKLDVSGFRCFMDQDRPVYVQKDHKILPFFTVAQNTWIQDENLLQIASQIDPLFSRREFQGSEPPQDKTKREEFFKQEYCNYLQFMYPDEDWYDEDVFVGSEIMSYDQWGIEVISMGPAQIPSEVQLGDYTIQCPEGEYLFVYDGKNFFCDIRYAYAYRLINDNDVYDIGWLYDPTFLERYPKEKGRIEPALRNRIRQDFLEYRNYPLYELTDIDIKKYFGIYHGCNIVHMMPADIRIPEIEPTEIAGYLIYDEDIYAYQDGTFLLLKEAYDAGWLTKQDIHDIKEKGF